MSKKRIVLLVSAALVVGVLAVGGGAAYVYAKGSAALGEGPPLPFLGGGFFGGRGGHHGMAGFAGEDGNPMEMFNAAAEALGMTPEEMQERTGTPRFAWLLNHGKQVYWLQRRFPEQFAQVTGGSLLACTPIQVPRQVQARPLDQPFRLHTDLV